MDDVSWNQFTQVEVPDRMSIGSDKYDRTMGCRAFKITRSGNTKEHAKIGT